jgi:hypothetical protein
MIHSRSRKFLFIHIPKTAGTSLRKVLRRHAPGPGPANFVARRIGRAFPGWTPLFLYRWRTFEAHLTLAEAEAMLPAAEVAAFFKFAVVRNPFDRLVSLYHHVMGRPGHPWHAPFSGLGGFEAVALRIAEFGEPSQLHYLRGRDGRIGMDFLARFETLEADYATIRGRLGLREEMPRLNARPRKPWRDFYSESSLEAVRAFYREDFEAFGYDPSGE